jgi:Na+-translocating ferredoxin:NAD+ oxidoreductase subunit D
MNLLTISGSPHLHSEQNVKRIMYDVILAMVPAMLISFYFFGLEAVRVTAIAVAACVITEYLIQKYLLRGAPSISDGSAIITGMLLAFNVPSGIPSWMVIMGAIVAIGVAKMSFGGLGKNPFNPALVGRVFMLISFPVEMTTWPVPQPGKLIPDAITGPTALGIVKEGGSEALPAYFDMLLGQMGGSLGEVSALALLIGAAYMFARKVITWEIPLSYLGSAMAFAAIFWLIDPATYADPLFHMLAGGMMLGVFYMATDMVSSPMSRKAQLVYGLGCGLLTMLIRIFGAYPEGVSFAILIMNAFTPLLNRAFKPKRFGETIKVAKG